MVLADIEALSRILGDLPLLSRYGRSASGLAADLRLALARGDGLLVHDDGAGPMGLAWFLPAGTFAMGGYLKLLAVARAASQQGRGSRLLEAFEDQTRPHSGHAFLLCSDFNTEAQHFYQRHGYVRVGELPALVLPGVSEVVFWKRLTGSAA
jgi:GNAT superfamily N-acetyltransferase